MFDDYFIMIFDEHQKIDNVYLLNFMKPFVLKLIVTVKVNNSLSMISDQK